MATFIDKVFGSAEMGSKNFSCGKDYHESAMHLKMRGESNFMHVPAQGWKKFSAILEPVKVRFFLFQNPKKQF